MPRAAEYIRDYGMSALVMEGTALLPEGVTGWEIWLGTDSPEKFTREILFMIDGDFSIYEYDPAEERWITRHLNYENEDIPTRTVLAHLMFDGFLENGMARFLLDEVKWVDDGDQPDGYRIDNGTQEWLPYIADEWLEVSLWHCFEDTGMELLPESLDGLIRELEYGWREGVLLASVTADANMLLRVREEYTL